MAGADSIERSAPLTQIELQQFADEADRRRFSPTALKAFMSLSREWRLANGEAASLLGVTDDAYDHLRRGAQPELSQDQLTRMSALLGVYKGLHRLFHDDAGDRWIRNPNTGPLFSGRTPIEAMIEGGIPTMIDVRRYIDAIREGP